MQVLADIVKLAQKRGMKGTKGVWKDFLNAHDRKFGASVSDPSKRTKDVLVVFLKSFNDENDLKVTLFLFYDFSFLQNLFTCCSVTSTVGYHIVLQFLLKVLQCYLNRNLVVQVKQESPDNEPLEQV